MRKEKRQKRFEVLNDYRTRNILINLAECPDYDLVCLLNDSLADTPGYGRGEDAQWLFAVLKYCVADACVYFQMYEIEEDGDRYGDEIPLVPKVRDILNPSRGLIVFSKPDKEWHYNINDLVMVRAY